MNSLLYAGALSAHKVPFELHIYPYGAHGLSTGDAQTNGNMNEKIEHVGNWLTSLEKWLKLIGFTRS